MSNDSSWIYTEQVKMHFLNPKNILTISEEEYKPDGVGIVGSPACGDMMMIFIKVKDEKIYDMKWKTYGCASAIASTSALSEMVTRNGGMYLKDAYRIKPEDIIRELGQLPSNKIHCSVLGDKALRAAIEDYYKRQNQENPYREKTSSPVVCECFQITEEDIKMEVLEGATNFETLQERTKIGTNCGKCITKTREVLNRYVEQYYKEKVYIPEEKS
ncbi:MAG: iron-sulfur cluster assembly scaffold protein [Exilispira sp.]